MERETGDVLLRACWEGSGTSSFPIACGCTTYCVKRYGKPTWKSEVKNCDLLTGTALKTSSYSCNAADARAAAQLRLALNTADAKPEMLQGTSLQNFVYSTDCKSEISGEQALCDSGLEIVPKNSKSHFSKDQRNTVLSKSSLKTQPLKHWRSMEEDQ
ncbi:hypothetical protein E5288_WYG019672 [Bos mutus]|uniref:Uncharacterized protein n=1 Tax=Bos mutus TaxID=72004 RepID=A0A6B0RT52_9CETA|nr:hypothetical protein [Bos mutus]